MSGGDVISLSVDSLHEQYVDGRLLPSTLLGQIAERIEVVNRPEVWIYLVPYADLLAQSARLDQALRQHGADVFKQMPLFGLPIFNGRDRPRRYGNWIFWLGS